MNRENALQSVIYEIANFVPGSSDGDMLLLRARELGFDPQLLYVPIAVDLYHFERYAKKIWDNARNTKVSPEDTVQSTKRHILFDIRAIFNHPLDIASMIGNSRYIILCAVDPEKRHDEKEVFKRVNRNCHKVLASFKKRGIEVSLGIGFFAEGIEDLSFSYSEAWKAIFLAKKFNWGPGVFDIQKLRLEELLSTTEVAIRDKFIHDKLSKMKDARLWEELRDTVEAWCNSGFRYVTAARDLGIHRNSLEYRLSNIKKITGLDPTRFKDCISLYIALELDRYVGSVDNVHKS
jgi:carbohydrate diacid regulator